MQRILKNYKILSLVAFLLFGSALFAQQDVLISQGGTVLVNTGDKFYDAGGATGVDGNTNYTITLKPALAGKKIALKFTSFKTHLNNYSGVQDRLVIYDGSTATGNNIASLAGDFTTVATSTGFGTTPAKMGTAATGSFAAVNTPTLFSAINASGDLTLQFVNGNNTTNDGWVAEIILYEDNATPGCSMNLTADKTSLCGTEGALLNFSGFLNSTPINNNFNSGTIGTGWEATSSATFTSNVCSAPSLDNSTYLWMQNANGPRSLVSNAMDVSKGGTISFDYRAAFDEEASSPCEASELNLTANTWEGVYVQYSTDNGVSWNTFKYLYPSATNFSDSPTNNPKFKLNGCGDYVNRWTKMTYPIPAAAQTATTKFRWIQQVATSATTDNWGLDNLLIATPNTSTITITNTATNAVILTSNNNTGSVAVNPTTTTTYRATISDGTTTCSKDITITVNSGTTSINYPGSPFEKTETSGAVQVIGTPVTGNYTASSTNLTINPATGEVNPSTSTPGTYTVTVVTACGDVNTTVTINAPAAPACGSCATPTCPIAGPFNNLGNAYDGPTYNNHCNNMVTLSTVVQTGNTYTSYYAVRTNNSGVVGLVITNGIEKINLAQPCLQITTRTAELYLSPNTCTGGVAQTPVIQTTSPFNPVWSGLTPNTNYIIKVTVRMDSANCQIKDQCASYYMPTCPTVSAITDKTACGGDTVSAINFASTPPSGSTTYSWTNNNTAIGLPGIGNGNIASFTTANVTTTQTATITVTATNGTCVGPPTTFKITVNPRPNAPTAPTPLSYCQFATGASPLSATATTGATLNWYGTNSTGGTASTNAPTPSTAAPGTTTYYVSQTLGGCESTRTAIVVNVNAKPNAPTVTSPVTYCQGALPSALDAPGTGLLWYTTPTGGTGSASAPTPSTSTPGTVKYYVSQTTTGCESDRALIDVVVNGTTAAPITCGTNTPTSVSFNWTAVPGATGYTVSHTINGGSAVNSGTITATTHSVTGLNSSITNNVTITVTPVGVTCPVATSFTCQPSSCPTPVTEAVSNIRTCPVSNVSSIVFRSPEPAATFEWSNDNTAIGLAGSGLGNLPNFTTADVTSVQTATISVQARYLTCVGPTMTFTITVYPTPATPGVTVVDNCDGTSTLSTTATGNLLWSNGETNATITVNTGGIYTVTTTVDGCPSLPGSGTAAPKTKPATPVITVVNNCDGTSTLSTTAAGTLQWSTGESTPSITVRTAATYAVDVTVNGCTSDLASATAAPKTTPATPTISTTAPTCAAAGTSTISNYDGNQTYTFLPPGPLVAAGGVLSNMTVGTGYTVIATFDGCPSLVSASFSNLAPLATPNAPTVTTPVNYCLNDTAALTTAPDVNHNLLWYTTATGGTGSTTAPTLDTSVAGSTIYYVSQVNNTTGCESARAAITVIVSQVTLDLTAGCNDADYTLTATAPAGATFEWYKGTNIVPEDATGNTLIVTTAGDYRVVATLNGCVTDATENVTSIYCAIPKGISPNNDTKNDTFDLTNFNVKKLQIFNRYGMEVYSKEQYKDEWDGKSNDGQVLPDGTYFYVIEFESGKTKTGWVYKNSEY